MAEAALNNYQENDQVTEKEGTPQEVGGVTGQRLRAFIERIERLEIEKSELAEDIKEVYGELKATGFDAKTVRTVIKLRKMEPEKRQEEQSLLETYLAAIGEL